jgi:hypothetical protein
MMRAVRLSPGFFLPRRGGFVSQGRARGSFPVNHPRPIGSAPTRPPRKAFLTVDGSVVLKSVLTLRGARRAVVSPRPPRWGSCTEGETPRGASLRIHRRPREPGRIAEPTLGAVGVGATKGKTMGLEPVAATATVRNGFMDENGASPRSISSRGGSKGFPSSRAGTGRTGRTSAVFSRGRPPERRRRA